MFDIYRRRIEMLQLVCSWPNKYLSVMFQENNMEVCVVKILNLAGAADYLPQFSRHRITIETLLQMSDDDLIRVSYMTSDIWCLLYGVSYMMSVIWCLLYVSYIMMSVMWCQLYNICYTMSIIWCQYMMSVLWCQIYDVSYKLWCQTVT